MTRPYFNYIAGRAGYLVIRPQTACLGNYQPSILALRYRPQQREMYSPSSHKPDGRRRQPSQDKLEQLEDP